MSQSNRSTKAAKSAAPDERHQRIADRHAQFEIQLRRAALRLHRQQEREARPKGLQTMAREMVEARNIRMFLDALEARLPPASLRPAHLIEWLSWAHGHAATLDPLSDENLNGLLRYTANLAHQPIDDETPDPDEEEWYHSGFLNEHLDALAE